MSQLCTQCGKMKPEEAFSWRVKNVRRHRRCKECHKYYNQQHYQKNKEKYNTTYYARRKKHQEEIREIIGSWLSVHPCEICGETDIVVLEFDHRADKNFDLGKAVHHGYALSKVRDEIKKCDVLCANCHRRKTASEQGWWKSKYGPRSG